MDPEHEPGFKRLQNHQDGYEGLENPAPETQDESGYTLPQLNRSYQKLYYPNKTLRGFNDFPGRPISNYTQYLSAYNNQPSLSLGYLDVLYYQGSPPSHSGYVDVMDYQTPFPLRTKRFTKRPVSMTTPSLSGFTDPTYGYVDVVDYPLPLSMGFGNKRTSRVEINNPYSGSRMLAVSTRPYSERSLHLPKQ